MRECGRRVALALRAAGEQHRAHAGGLADAHGADVGLDELHRVVNRQSGADRPAGRIDVQRDVLVRIFRLQEQQLRDDQVRHVVLDRTHDEDHALLQQPRIDVISTFAASGLLDDHGDEIHNCM